VAKLRADDGLSTRRACSKCRIPEVNLCGLSPDEAPTTLVTEEALQDPYIFFAQAIPLLQYGAESSYEGFAMDSTTMNDCLPHAAVHSQSG